MIASAAAAALAIAATPATTPMKPNIVILFCDDAGYGDFGFTGHPTIRTPNIDRMAREGIWFTQYYSGSPACTASRYALLTGRDPRRSGFAWVLSPNSKKSLHQKEVTIAEGLKSAGYATGAFGKWHLGNPSENNGYDQSTLPLAHGFDEYVGLPYSNDMRPPKNWPDLPLLEGPAKGTGERYTDYRIRELNPDQTQLTKLYTDKAVSFINRHKDEPFFVYLPYAMPHVPLYPGEAFQGSSRRGNYGDVMQEIDWSAGRIMEELRKLELAENTLVFFTSDNGPWIIKNDQGGSSGLFRDGKGSTWEGGVREPGIAWWPGHIKPRQRNMQPVGAVDILPTVFDVAGVKLPDDRTLDGMSLVPLMKGTGSLPERPLYYSGPGNKFHAIRYGRYKLHMATSSQTKIKHFNGRVPLLFNLNQDPSEKYDLSRSQPEQLELLQELFSASAAQVKEEGTFWD